MNTVLVVEDEKLIRQGIAAMIKRSGVPVGEVLECSNGLQALDILKERKVDVMFTDIRMPKMNGIELVQALQNLDEPPLTIAVSGYDDFSYAVEMMRQGVREYILKPVEREKLKDVLGKLEEELSYRQETEKKTKDASDELMKYLLEDESSSDEVLKILSNRILKEVGEIYQVVVATEDFTGNISGGIKLYPVEEQKVFIASPKAIDEAGLQKEYIGISDVYSKIDSLKAGYFQAKCRRYASFIESIPAVDSDGKPVVDSLIEKGIKLCAKEQLEARVQLIGTQRLSEFEKEWRGFFVAASRQQIPAKEFLKAIEDFFISFKKVYHKDYPDKLSKPITYSSLDEYMREFYDFCSKANEEILLAMDANPNDLKLQAAIKYINENYAKDLNMAVVSNEISMNYSLFSAAFKNYTGVNFVSYVKKLRMDKAKQLLTDTDMKVNEISSMVGYDNEKHFLKSFKAFVGVSPSEYRKNSLNT